MESELNGNSTDLISNKFPTSCILTFAVERHLNFTSTGYKLAYFAGQRLFRYYTEVSLMSVVL